MAAGGFFDKAEYIGGIKEISDNADDEGKLISALDTLFMREEATEELFLPLLFLRKAFSLSKNDTAALYILAGNLFFQNRCKGLNRTLQSPIFTKSGLHSLVEDFLLDKELRLPSYIKISFAREVQDEECYHSDRLLSELIDFVRTVTTKHTLLPAAIQLYGKNGSGKRFLIKKAAASIACNIIEADGNYPLEEEDINAIYLLSVIYQGIVCLHNAPNRHPLIFSNRFPLLFLTAVADTPIHTNSTLLYRKLPDMTQVQRESASIKLFGEDLGNSLHSLTIGQLIAVSQRKRAEDIAKYGLSAAALIQSEQDSDEIGWEKIEIRKTFEDLILPAAQKEQLLSVCGFIKSREQVFNQWGFAEKISYGRGISLLFYGSSGTGKTMAAGVMANMLSMRLYRVDLSQLISKYVGETQKNIGRVFDRAKGMNCILFFDEADALFGRRSEQSDAQDKYANAEIAYLLQKTESYDGVMILATNLLQNFDEAFRRRIGYMISFPVPDQAARQQLWEGIFPSSAPTASLDYELLSTLELTGAGIKNTALNSAYMAASQKTEITMKRIIEAASLEYQKQGKQLSDKFMRMYLDGQGNV